MASFASSATTGGAHKHAWTKIYDKRRNCTQLLSHMPFMQVTTEVWIEGVKEIV